MPDSTRPRPRRGDGQSVSLSPFLHVVILLRRHFSTSPLFLRDFEQPAAVNDQRNHGFYRCSRPEHSSSRPSCCSMNDSSMRGKPFEIPFGIPFEIPFGIPFGVYVLPVF